MIQILDKSNLINENTYRTHIEHIVQNEILRVARYYPIIRIEITMIWCLTIKISCIPTRRANNMH